MNLLSALSFPAMRYHRNIVYRSIFHLEDREVPAHDRQRDVVDRHRADEALVCAGMPVTVQDEIRRMVGNRPPKAIAPQERPDSGRLALDRRRGRRVVEEHDADRAIGDGLQSPLEGLDLVRGLCVDRPQDRLAEVGERRIGKATDEALGPDHPDLRRAAVEDRPASVEDDDSRGGQDVLDLTDAVRVPVVVPENRHHGDFQAAAGVGDYLGLLGLPQCRQVAREKNCVDPAGDVCECLGDGSAVLLAAMDVARCGDPDGVSFHHPGQEGTPIVPMSNDSLPAMLATLKRSAGALREAGVPFMLGGGLACWVRGGPESDHDLDLMVKPEDAEQALATLAAIGLRPEKPSEGWLYKAFDEDDVMVDIIFSPVGVAITDEVLARAEMLEVEAQPMLVMTLEDVLVTKLLALDENSLDYKAVLQIARSLREQIDWEDVRSRTAGSAYAAAFFTLVEELGVAATSRNEG
jgi:putative nucleotidyltransferase-like protein